MSKTHVIYKYELACTDIQLLHLPADAEILSIQLQNGNICAWAKLNPAKPKVSRKIIMAGTGGPVSDAPMRHIATVQAGVMVWHFFEED